MGCCPVLHAVRFRFLIPETSKMHIGGLGIETPIPSLWAERVFPEVHASVVDAIEIDPDKIEVSGEPLGECQHLCERSWTRTGRAKRVNETPRLKRPLPIVERACVSPKAI